MQHLGPNEFDWSKTFLGSSIQDALHSSNKELKNELREQKDLV